MAERVNAVRAAAYTVPTDRPEADGTYAWDSTTAVVATAEAAGEAGVGWTYGPAAAAALINDQLAAAVRGADPMEPPRSWSAMVRAVRNAPRAGLASYAISAVDIALWDLKARLLGLALHRLLGPARSTVPVYGSGGFTTYDEATLAGQLDGWAEERFAHVKIKIGESWGSAIERDLARMRQARRVLGPGIELFVDANGAYTAKQAIAVARRAADLDVRWFEEPVSSDDLAGLWQVRDAVAPEVAAGEYGTDVVYFQRMVAAGAVDCLQADISRCGGITEWMRVAAVAAAAGLDLSGHCAPHLHAPAALATPNLRHVEWFHDHVRIESLLFDGVLDPVGGLLALDDFSPGHGLTLKHQDAARFRVA